MAEKNIGRFEVGAYPDITHVIGIPAQGAGVDVDPVLIPKAEFSTPPVYLISKYGTTTSTSPQNVKGALFSPIEPMTIDRVYITTDLPSPDTLTFTIAEITGSTITAIPAQVIDAVVGTGAMGMYPVTLPAPLTLETTKRYAFLVHTTGKANNFGTRVRNGDFGQIPWPLKEMGYCTAVVTEPIVGSVLTVTASTGEIYMTAGMRVLR